MGTRIRFLLEPPRTAVFNMARDFFFLKKAEEEETFPFVFSVYSFMRPCITVGRLQTNLHFIKKAEELSVEVAKRPTGGRAVLHSPSDITYSFVFKDIRFAAKSIRDVYEFIKPVLEYFLHELGIETDKYNSNQDSYREKTLCFLSNQPADLMVRGKKACGNALLKLKKAHLLQGTFHYKLERNLASLLFGEDAVNKLLAKTLFLKDVAPGANVFKAAEIFERVLAKLGYKVERSRLTFEETEEIKRISESFEFNKSYC